MPNGYWEYEIYEVSWQGSSVVLGTGTAPINETDVLSPAANTKGVVQGRVEIGKLYITGATGQEAGGYTKDSTAGKDINFILVHRPSVLGVTKHIAPRVFTPETNQDADAYKFQ